LFDWPRLARAGIGLWPDFSQNPARLPESIGEIQQALAAYGYEIPSTGVLDRRTLQVLIAFQRHFRPADCDGRPDDETRRRLALVAAAV